MYSRTPRLYWAGVLLAVVISNAQARPEAKASTQSLTTLKQAFDAAWARQPEAKSQDARHTAATTRREYANNWTVEPPALELSAKTDQLSRNHGAREYVAGIAIPLWLPGERSKTGTLADAELRAVESKTMVAKLRTAASVREMYWQWQRAMVEHELAQARLTNAQKFSADVTRRTKAGDLARSDQHQADGVVATAEAAVAESSSALSEAMQRLRSFSGLSTEKRIQASYMATEREPSEINVRIEQIPTFVSLRDRAEVARKAYELVSVQTRANPELTLSTTRERSINSDPYQQSITFGIRIPFGSDSRNKNKMATARAEAVEAETQLTLERERIVAEIETAKHRLSATRHQLAAARRRAQLAKESSKFFEKSFRLGETGLPMMLRIELETFESERQAVLARIELAAAISGLRQVLGMLPE